MTFLVTWTLIIGIVTSIACALCGVFLVVKREAFVSEGLSHAVLPGIILAYALFRDRSSPWLVICAGLSGMLMVWLVKAITLTRKVDRDAALGIVFSGLFSIGIIASSLRLGSTHFHAHCIIDGNLSFAALSRFEVFGYYLGPKTFVTMSLCLLVIIGFIVVCYKELVITTFDETSASLFGFSPAWIHSIWLTIVSMTTVAAFETAGTILVVALMITPPATANLLTQRIPSMLWLSALIAALDAALGIGLAIWLDISPAGPISAVAGMVFLVTFAMTYFCGSAGLGARRSN